MIHFILNNKEISTSLPAGTLLLDFIRYEKNLTGTKIGCREGDCGACTVLIGEIQQGELAYRSVTSCLMPIGNAHGKHIVTIEGINVEGLNFIQQAFADEGATQCGFCTPGFIVSLAGYSINKKNITAVDAVNGNICRCTGYKSIERAAQKITDKINERKDEDVLAFAVKNKFLPEYFLTIKERLAIYLLQTNGIEKSNSSNAKFVGGGTDLYVQQHEAMVHADIDFMFNKSQLNGIEQQGNKCIMGASVTVADIAESPIFKKHFADLDRYIKLVSSTQIRNMATVAGNFVNASPIGDLTIFFLSLDAQLVLSDGATSREMPLRKLYKGYKTLDKNPEEYIEKIYFELPAATSKFNFEKVCKRTYLDIASVNTAIYLNMSGDAIINAGISAGGVGPVPAFLPKSSAFLAGKKISIETMQGLIDIAQTEIMPISDARGTESYKRLLLSQLIKAHFVSLFPQLNVEEIIA
ncbi:FAD binding domain-containing protein [Ferruginibacter lapsinanis]|uniref:FAD binding domain-containing protein n=1 Tax=Ferruginibacter lapsinanis TaxID=563172 RepID=UPI001E338DC1|nr:FAD binding domain-containing protein [Ferruginibacter lapsinanis]UEG49816.1 FAD binding domain-containing protein [Ferruginibacter lapsinanis]